MKRTYTNPRDESALRLPQITECDGEISRNRDQILPSLIQTIPGGIRQNYWQRASHSAKRLFEFLCSLNFEEIPEILLLRMADQTAIWGPNGYRHFENTPLVDPVVDDITSGKAFNFILLFLSIQLIQEHPADFGRTVFTISHEVRSEFGQDSSRPMVSEWPRLVLICHAFPGHWEEKWLDYPRYPPRLGRPRLFVFYPRFVEHGRILLP